MRVIRGPELEKILEHVHQRVQDGADQCRIWIRGRVGERVQLGNGPIVKLLDNVDGDGGNDAYAWADQEVIRQLLENPDV
jgi:hypothetical protein